jgi:hypothetical protein
MIHWLAQGGAGHGPGAAAGGVARLLEGDTLVLLVGGAIAITAIVASALRHIVTSSAREKTRREIAAYIAEGSMSPEQGEKLMGAGETRPRC